MPRRRQGRAVASKVDKSSPVCEHARPPGPRILGRRRQTLAPCRRPCCGRDLGPHISLRRLQPGPHESSADPAGRPVGPDPARNGPVPAPPRAAATGLPSAHPGRRAPAHHPASGAARRRAHRGPAGGLGQRSRRLPHETRPSDVPHVERAAGLRPDAPRLIEA